MKYEQQKATGEHTGGHPEGRLVMMMTVEELEDEAAGLSICYEGVGARVLRLYGLAARPLPLPQPPNTSRPRRRPREVQGAGDTDDGVAGAARSGTRHLIGPVILPPATLIVAAAVLLVTRT